MRRRSSGSERGSYTVEAALVLPVLLVVTIAVFEAIATVTLYIEVVAAAREGARVAATVPDPEAAVRAVRSSLGELGREARVDVVRPGEVGALARVTVRLDRRLATPLLDGIRVPLGTTAAMRVEP